MSHEIVPAENDVHGNGRQEPPQGESSRRRKKARWRRRPRIFSREECLALLSQLPAMVQLGMMTPAQSNATRAALESILSEHRTAAGGTVDRAVPQSLLEIARERPELQAWIEPLLSEDQIRELMGDDDEQQ